MFSADSKSASKSAFFECLQKNCLLMLILLLLINFDAQHTRNRSKNEKWFFYKCVLELHQ
jgi:hypothetical protein